AVNLLTHTLSLHDALPIFMACFKGIPSAVRRFIKSINNTELRTIIPAKAIIPIKEVAVKKAPIIQWPSTIPINDKGIATIITIRSEEHTSELQSRENLVCR